MYAQLYGATLYGIEGHIIKVEVDISQGLPAFDIVGLPNQSVRESRERVRAAIKNSGYEFPMRRIVVNLAPASLRKCSAGLDLAIAFGILLAAGQIKGRKQEIQKIINHSLFMGELSLDGQILHTDGSLAMALAALTKDISTVFTCDTNRQIIQSIPNVTVFGAQTLQAVVSYVEKYVKGNTESLHISEPISIQDHEEPNYMEYPIDFSDVQGQELGKRAMLISAAGHHHCLMIGPPGAGKTMMAERLPTILPPMCWEEILEVSRIQDVLGLLDNNRLAQLRPFRYPHHTATLASMIGGGSMGKPGEITLAHGGVLFLDEVAEFPRSIIDALRQPLESRTITITRSHGNYIYPANFICILAANPCPCGYYGDAIKACTCTDMMVRQYQSRLSGPIMDRIDLHIPVERPTLEQLLDGGISTTSSMSMREKVVRARQVQHRRYKDFGFNTNGELPHRAIKELCQVTDHAWRVAGNIFSRLHLSGRSFDRILKVARTIADLEGNPIVEPYHISEAVMFRPGV